MRSEIVDGSRCVTYVTLACSGSSTRLPSAVLRPTGFRTLQIRRRVPAAFSIHPGAILFIEFTETLGLAAYRLAKDLHISIPRVNDLVRGKRGNDHGFRAPPTPLLRQLCAVLDRVAERLALVGRLQKQGLEQGEAAGRKQPKRMQKSRESQSDPSTKRWRLPLEQRRRLKLFAQDFV